MWGVPVFQIGACSMFSLFWHGYICVAFRGVFDALVLLVFGSLVLCSFLPGLLGYTGSFGNLE